MIILLDAMGGDNAPDANIKGAVKAVNEVSQSTEILLIAVILSFKRKPFL